MISASGKMENTLSDLRTISNELRMLCADMVQNANSGHPGAPLGLADLVTVLSSHIIVNPMDPGWINRDRLVFSGGHVSALVYSLLYLWGFDLSLNDLKSFRKLGSKTPGHPEHGSIQGIEVTTGPLGQGVANSVGLALASKRARHLIGDCINHKVYCLCGDGDLQEGISYEACSFAGHNKLDNLILIYDSNGVSIDGRVDITFSEDIKTRFVAQGFDVFECDGHDYVDIDSAISKAKNSTKPSIIVAKTTIAKGAEGVEGDYKTHGSPLGEDIIRITKKKMGLPTSEFHVSPRTAIYFSQVRERGDLEQNKWRISLSKEELLALDNAGFKSPSLEGFGHFSTGENIPTRESNRKILNFIANNNPYFMGGSADLSTSNGVVIENSLSTPDGQNIHFGIREHSMASITCGIAGYGLFVPFCATFFVFSDYMAPSIRVASIMKTNMYYIFTHDSIGVGEDGATHQPVEHISHLRSIPNLTTWRVADANENILAWQVALGMQGPHAFVLSRQKLPVLASPELKDFSKGAYVIERCISDCPELTLMSSGSEVSLCINAKRVLESEGISVQVVSVPSFDIFVASGKDYAKQILGDSKVLCVEASIGFEWWMFANDVICMDSFGVSGRSEEVFRHFGFSVENICARAKALIQ